MFFLLPGHQSWIRALRPKLLSHFHGVGFPQEILRKFRAHSPYSLLGRIHSGEIGRTGVGESGTNRGRLSFPRSSLPPVCTNALGEGERTRTLKDLPPLLSHEGLWRIVRNHEWLQGSWWLQSSKTPPTKEDVHKSHIFQEAIVSPKHNGNRQATYLKFTATCAAKSRACSKPSA